MKKNTRQVSIQSRRRLFFLRPVCLFFVFFLVVTIFSNSYRLYQLNNDKKNKEEEYNKLQEETEYLKNEIIKLNNPEYIAKFARENYSYSKDGELIIKIEENKEKNNVVETNMTNTKTDYRIYLYIGVAIFILYGFVSLMKRKGNE